MRIGNDTKSALAITAAMAGAGFSSGREVIAFFTRMGASSWIGVIFASLAIGYLVDLLARFVNRTGADSYPDIFRRVMGRECGVSVHVLYALITVVTCAVMLTAAGEVGQMAFSFRGAYVAGALVMLAAAVFLSRGTGNRLCAAGGLIVVGVVVYYIALLFTPQDASLIQNTIHEEPLISGWMTVPAAVFLAGLYAALNASMAGSVLAVRVGADGRSGRIGRKVGLFMMILLGLANGVFRRAGEGINQYACPAVVLSRSWGVIGYYAALALMAVCVITTLAACLIAMRREAEFFCVREMTAICVGVSLAVTMTVVGFISLVGVGYPMLGWMCALTLPALILFRDEIQFDKEDKMGDNKW